MSNVIPFHAPKKLDPAMRRGRGRPKTPREEKDFGTPELQAKRHEAETMEALDLCLEKALITPEQHWCGIHLRWLYTLRYGAPGLRALDPTHVDGMELECDDPEWRVRREAEYHEALGKITAQGCAATLMNLCVHNERPGFLRNARRNIIRNSIELEKFRDGLELLVKHWKRERKQ